MLDSDWFKIELHLIFADVMNHNSFRNMALERATPIPIQNHPDPPDTEKTSIYFDQS